MGVNGPARHELEPWPRTPAELEAEQYRLGQTAGPVWRPQGLGISGATDSFPTIGASFVCFGRGGAGPGAAGDAGWAAAAGFAAGAFAFSAVVQGRAPAAYAPGHLALREGALHEAALRALPNLPELLLVDATGRDHPRRAGLALHLGARLGVPSLGVTNRLLVATGAPPPDVAGAATPFLLEGEVVGWWLCVRRGVRPLAVHAAWRTDPETALAIVRSCLGRTRTPEPLRTARRLAREERSRAGRGSRQVNETRRNGELFSPGSACGSGSGAAARRRGRSGRGGPPRSPGSCLRTRPPCCRPRRPGCGWRSGPGTNGRG